MYCKDCSNLKSNPSRCCAVNKHGIFVPKKRDVADCLKFKEKKK